MPLRVERFPFSVTLSDVRAADGRIAFTATFDDRAPDQWTSQGWVIIATETPPWDLPTQLFPDGMSTVAMWFVSYLNPGKRTTSLVYEFDFLVPGLAVRREHGVLSPSTCPKRCWAPPATCWPYVCGMNISRATGRTPPSFPC